MLGLLARAVLPSVFPSGIRIYLAAPAALAALVSFSLSVIPGHLSLVLRCLSPVYSGLGALARLLQSRFSYFHTLQLFVLM